MNEENKLNLGSVIERFNITKHEAKLYNHLLRVTKNKPHNISKGVTYKRALALQAKGLCDIKDLGHRVLITANAL